MPLEDFFVSTEQESQPSENFFKYDVNEDRVNEVLKYYLIF